MPSRPSENSSREVAISVISTVFAVENSAIAASNAPLFGQTLKTAVTSGALLCASSHAALAMSLRDAGENLLYFEHARLSAEYCEKQNASARPALASWHRETMPLYRQATEAIRAEGAKRGLSGAEQEEVLKAVIEDQRKAAKENIATKGVRCKNFGAVLEMYSTLLKR